MSQRETWVTVNRKQRRRTTSVSVSVHCWVQKKGQLARQAKEAAGDLRSGGRVQEGAFPRAVTELPSRLPAA